MKKTLSIIVLCLLLSGNAYSEMSYDVDKDEFSGKTYHYIMSNYAKPNKPLSFPYADTESSLIVACLEGGHHFSYIWFNSLNLTGGKTNDGYELHTLEVKAGGSFENIWATQDFGKKTLDFNMTKSDKKRIIELMRMNDEIMIQLNHYQDGKRFYKYDTKGFSKLFDQHC